MNRTLGFGLGAILLTAVSLSAGCSGDLIEPAMDIDDRRMLIVPFKDQAYFYYESAIGTRLARSISRRLEDERKEYDDDVIEVVAFEEIVKAVRDDDPSELSHQEIAERTEADTILIGDIKKWQTRVKGDVGVIRGRAEIKIKVVKADDPQGRPLLERRIEASYPPDDYRNYGFLPVAGNDEATIERGLMEMLTDRIAKHFYFHLPEGAR